MRDTTQDISHLKPAECPTQTMDQLGSSISCQMRRKSVINRVLCLQILPSPEALGCQVGLPEPGCHVASLLPAPPINNADGGRTLGIQKIWPKSEEVSTAKESVAISLKTTV
ncbi:hypothetical protein DdX_04190 [Ditylenchus destructor]|uniref:Uncharacterized protein n=1 Tax=Ditylenchus destructor TaxID=166010 RepID=A0AAD4N7V1_9BILA|nr:hypothetical protein DdX_04190 [Ditylenchus destructor]